jgi:glycosyltransferase involved in cell wall biosynthesis
MIMASSNEKAYDKSISEQAEELENLTFLGFVPFQIINKEYQNARLFVSTSLSEGFPNTFLQAWQCKVPVVSMYVDPDGVINRYDLGMVSGSRQQFIEDIQSVLNDRLKWSKLSDNATSYVQDNHSVQAAVKSYNKLFNQLGLVTKSQLNYD